MDFTIIGAGRTRITKMGALKIDAVKLGWGWGTPNILVSPTLTISIMCYH